MVNVLRINNIVQKITVNNHKYDREANHLSKIFWLQWTISSTKLMLPRLQLRLAQSFTS